MTAVYLLPGTMCDQRMWLPMLKKVNTTETFKQIDGGIEPHFLTIANADTIDDILLDIAKQLPDKAINLLGFSLGGYLATAFALKYPTRVAKLLVMSNMPCALPDAEVRERTRTVNWIKKHGYKGIPKKRINNLLHSTNHDKTDITDLIEEMDRDLGEDILRQQLLATTQRENLFKRLPALAIPKYFCVGEQDKLVSIESLEQLTKSDPNVVLTTVANTGHMLPMESPNSAASWLRNVLIEKSQHTLAF